jgi:hypothetical protein
MGKNYEAVEGELASWIARQRMFFVSTAPLATDGFVNCSPKSAESFRILGPRSVGYLDLTGSGVETIAHLRENGRIVFLFCAFEGPPRLVRLHGRGTVVTPESPEWPAASAPFPAHPAARAIVRAELTRISTSCGYTVPKYAYEGERDDMDRWLKKKGEAALPDYRRRNNRSSLDGLPGIDG